MFRYFNLSLPYETAKLLKSKMVMLIFIALNLYLIVHDNVNLSFFMIFLYLYFIYFNNSKKEKLVTLIKFDKNNEKNKKKCTCFCTDKNLNYSCDFNYKKTHQDTDAPSDEEIYSPPNDEMIFPPDEEIDEEIIDTNLVEQEIIVDKDDIVEDEIIEEEKDIVRGAYNMESAIDKPNEDTVREYNYDKDYGILGTDITKSSLDDRIEDETQMQEQILLRKPYDVLPKRDKKKKKAQITLDNMYYDESPLIQEEVSDDSKYRSSKYELVDYPISVEESYIPPMEEIPIQESLMQEALMEEAPIEEAQMEESLMQESLMQEDPMQESLMEESPIQEIQDYYPMDIQKYPSPKQSGKLNLMFNYDNIKNIDRTNPTNMNLLFNSKDINLNDDNNDKLCECKLKNVQMSCQCDENDIYKIQNNYSYNKILSNENEEISIAKLYIKKGQNLIDKGNSVSKRDKLLGKKLIKSGTSLINKGKIILSKKISDEELYLSNNKDTFNKYQIQIDEPNESKSVNNANDDSLVGYNYFSDVNMLNI